MVIGTRRRFGGAAGEEDGAGSSIGADRCPKMCEKSQKRGVGNAAKASRRAYCLSLPVHNKRVHTRELGLDSFVVRF